MDVTPADILEQAVEVLEANEWIVGHEHMSIGGGLHAYCAVGALRKASCSLLGTDMSQTFFTAMDVLKQKINEPVDRPHVTIQHWNDFIAMTKDNVIDTMKHATKEYRNEH